NSSFSFTAPMTSPTNTLSLHDALPISNQQQASPGNDLRGRLKRKSCDDVSSNQAVVSLKTSSDVIPAKFQVKSLEEIKKEKMSRSEEHTSELQSRGHLVCRLLLEKKKK